MYSCLETRNIGENLQAVQELDNKVDNFAGKVVKNNEIVGHFPRERSRSLWYFITRGRKIWVKLTAVDVTANTCVEEWRFPVGWCLAVRVK